MTVKKGRNQQLWDGYSKLLSFRILHIKKYKSTKCLILRYLRLYQNNAGLNVYSITLSVPLFVNQIKVLFAKSWVGQILSKSNLYINIYNHGPSIT